MTQRQLFGGAILMNLPARFDDVGTIRQVPDNQEVFSDPTTDQSVVVELLELTGEPDNQTAAFHFAELASQNEAANSQISRQEQLSAEQMPSFAPNISKWALFGTQQVSKFKEHSLNTVNVYMCVVRLPQQATEILITLNDGVVVNLQSSSATHVVGEKSATETMELWKAMLHSLRIVDYGLFA